MIVTKRVSRNERKRLLDGDHRMVCPRCKVWQDVLRFVPLEQIAEYERETAPIYKCALCRWVFAPLVSPLD